MRTRESVKRAMRKYNNSEKGKETKRKYREKNPNMNKIAVFKHRNKELFKEIENKIYNDFFEELEKVNKKEGGYGKSKKG